MTMKTLEASLDVPEKSEALLLVQLKVRRGRLFLCTAFIFAVQAGVGKSPTFFFSPSSIRQTSIGLNSGVPLNEALGMIVDARNVKLLCLDPASWRSPASFAAAAAADVPQRSVPFEGG